MSRAPPSTLSRLLALAAVVLAVPVSLWLIPEPAPPRATDAPALPPVDAPALEPPDPRPEDAIRGALDSWYACVNSGDAARLATLWATLDDVVADFPGESQVRGRAAVEALFRTRLGSPAHERVEPGRVRIRTLGGRAEVALLESVSVEERGSVRRSAHVATHVLFRTDGGWRWVAYRRLPERGLAPTTDAGP